MVGEGVTECEHAFILLEGGKVGTKTKMSMSMCSVPNLRMY